MIGLPDTCFCKGQSPQHPKNAHLPLWCCRWKQRLDFSSLGWGGGAAGTTVPPPERRSEEVADLLFQVLHIRLLCKLEHSQQVTWLLFGEIKTWKESQGQ